MTLTTDWTLDETAARRDRYYAASQRKFVPFREPIVFKKGSMQYLWDAEGRKYTDLLGMNVCISVGHSHPKVVAAATAQAQELTHCTTMFYHPVPAHLAEELAATMPNPDGSIEWVVHFTNSGSEAVDLAATIARTYTGNLDLLALRTAYHGPTATAQSLTGISGWRHPGCRAMWLLWQSPTSIGASLVQALILILMKLSATFRAQPPAGSQACLLKACRVTVALSKCPPAI